MTRPPAEGPEWAADVVWFDDLTINPDRTPRNANLIVDHGRTWLIDHGSALYVHHAWNEPDAHAARPFDRIGEHILLPFAGSIERGRCAPGASPGSPDDRTHRRRDPRRMAERWPLRWPGRRAGRVPALPGRPARGSPDLGRRRGADAPTRFSVTPSRSPFSYAVLRVVPDIEREEFVNAGLVLFCRSLPLPAGAHHRSTPSASARCGRAPIWTRCRAAGAVERIAAGDVASGPPGRHEPVRAFPLAHDAAQHGGSAGTDPRRDDRRPRRNLRAPLYHPGRPTSSSEEPETMERTSSLTDIAAATPPSRRPLAGHHRGRARPSRAGRRLVGAPGRPPPRRLGGDRFRSVAAPHRRGRADDRRLRRAGVRPAPPLRPSGRLLARRPARRARGEPRAAGVAHPGRVGSERDAHRVRPVLGRRLAADLRDPLHDHAAQIRAAREGGR